MIRFRSSLFLALAVPCLLLLLSRSAAGETAAERAVKAGKLTKEKRCTVLKLYGNDVKERGFAHGWLLADRIIDSLDDALRSLPLFSKRKYETNLLGWAHERFHWDSEIEAELEGLFEGMRAKLGDKALRSAVLERKLTKKDLYAINTIADYFGPACSGFTAWRSRTKDGKVIHGRNLDFPIGSRAVSNQVVLAIEPLPARGKLPARKGWIGVGWPGLVGVYSAMNADGLVCCLHDANNVLRGGLEKGFICRGLLLRRMVETIDPSASDAGAASAKMAGIRPTACGNLFHMSWPSVAAAKTKTQPSVVLEFDAVGRDGSGEPVSVRRMDSSDKLVVTNHYCVRTKPDACDRFEKISAGVAKLSGVAGKIDLKAARKILIGGEQKFATVAHTLVFLPDALTMHVAITRGNSLSTRIKGVAFSYSDLMKRSK